MKNDTALQMTGISKNFGPVAALKSVSFQARYGTIHALCGENGAGKSTLMKILSGLYPPDSGSIAIDGAVMAFADPKMALDAGISMLYQELDLAGELTVYENVFLGCERMHPKFPLMMDRKTMLEATRELIRANGFTLDAEAKIRDLSPGECQIVELLKALHRQAKILVMDEPTSSLSEGEAENLFAVVRRLRDAGMAIVYISHRMEEVKLLADEISVLRDGVSVRNWPDAACGIPEIVHQMVGREVTDFYPPRQSRPGEAVLQVTDLATAEGIAGVTFALRRGAITGMAGLVGAGRTETARALFGIEPLTAGTIILGGRKLRLKRPADAIDAGIALLTEDRKRNGLCLNLACSWNIELPDYTRLGMKYWISPAKERAEALRLGETLRVKWGTPDDPASSLSGGNQQKLLFARWLPVEPEVIIVDEPTRGVDVGAKREIYQLLDNLAAEGKAVLMISSDLPELFGVCDTLLIMRRKRLVTEVEVKNTTPDQVMGYMAIEE